MPEPPDRPLRETPPPRAGSQYERDANREQVQSRFRTVVLQRFEQLRHDVGNLAISLQQRQGEIDRRLHSLSRWQQLILAALLVNMALTVFWNHK